MADTTHRHQKITAVIVNWNKKEYIINLLDSLSLLNWKDLTIVVVDNASTDGSREALKLRCDEIHLIENKENLGGTGGFNTGIRYALNHLQQEFIWLLDNDATVAPDSLGHLVAAMEQDPDVALAGSRIVNPDDHGAVTETGAFISWRQGDVTAVNRNARNDAFEENIIDVDYVAVCSALVRSDALSRVGLMDERYFILWDDMDWGARFKAHGYRVVCATGSVVYHPAFTEKRSVVVDNYYGIRNPLLAISKCTGGLTRLLGLFSVLCRAKVLTVLFRRSGETPSSALCSKAVADFLSDTWGRLDFDPKAAGLRTRKGLPLSSFYGQRLLVLPTGNGDDINRFAAFASEFRNGGGRVSLLIQKDRRLLFEGKGFDEIYEFEADMMWHPVTTCRRFFRLLFAGFDAAFKPASTKVTLFSFAIRRVYLFHSLDNTVEQTREGLSSLPVTLILLAFGLLRTLTLFPFVYLKSTRYNSQQEV